MRRLTVVTVGLVLALVSFPQHASASIILGGSIFVQQDGNVTVEYLGDFADFTSGLFLAPFGAGDPFDPDNYIFVNNGIKGSPGDQVDLGFFTAGTELIFGLFVSDTQNTFFTGPPSNNTDAMAHAQLVTDPVNDIDPFILATFLPTWAPGDGTIVGFEDRHANDPLNDEDYNDLIYSFTNIGPRQPQVPEPATLVLLGGGVAGFLARRRRANRRSV